MSGMSDSMSEFQEIDDKERAKRDEIQAALARKRNGEASK
jgi:hypothetical protein